ncbi:MAG: YbjN domain-containing protein [Isosphaeraceae bacterium]
MLKRTPTFVLLCMAIPLILVATGLPATRGQEKNPSEADDTSNPRATKDQEKKNAESSTNNSGRTLEGLLKEAGLDYSRTTDGQYRTALDIGGEASVITASEKHIGEQKVAYLWCVVTTVPKEFRPTVAMLRRIAEMNNGLIIGNIGMDKQAIYYDSSFWLRTADERLLKDQLAVAHYTRLNLRKELLPYLQE